MASLHPPLPMTGSKPSFSPWLQGQVREHIFSLTPYAQCGSVPGPQQVVTKYILKWYMNNISPHHGFKMISGNDKKKKIEQELEKISPPLQVSCQYSTFSEVPLPYLGVCRQSALVGVFMHQLSYCRTGLCQQLSRALWTIPRLPRGQMPSPMSPGEPAASRLLTVLLSMGENTNWENAGFKRSHGKKINIS